MYTLCDDKLLPKFNVKSPAFDVSVNGELATSPFIVPLATSGNPSVGETPVSAACNELIALSTSSLLYASTVRSIDAFSGLRLHGNGAVKPNAVCFPFNAVFISACVYVVAWFAFEFSAVSVSVLVYVVDLPAFKFNCVSTFVLSDLAVNNKSVSVFVCVDLSAFKLGAVSVSVFGVCCRFVSL